MVVVDGGGCGAAVLELRIIGFVLADSEGQLAREIGVAKQQRGQGSSAFLSRIEGLDNGLGASHPVLDDDGAAHV